MIDSIWWWVLGLIVFLVSTHFVFHWLRPKIVKAGVLFSLELVRIFLALFLIFHVAEYIPTVNKVANSFLSNSAVLVAVLVFILQTTLKNLISGIILTMSKSFNVGDRITIISKQLSGQVEKIALRHTILRTYQNERVVIPNSVMNDEIFSNSDLSDTQTSYPIDLYIGIDKDIDLAVDIIKQVVSDHHLALNKEDCQTFCNQITADGKVCLRTFVLAEKADDSFKVNSDIRFIIVRELLLPHCKN